MSKIKTIMVTGSSGTVGSALVFELLRQKYTVIPVDIRPSLWDPMIYRKTVRVDLSEFTVIHFDGQDSYWLYTKIGGFREYFKRVR